MEESKFNFSEEVKINYENIEQFSYSDVIVSNFTKIDTFSIFSVKWIDSLTNIDTRVKEREKLERWLREKLDLDTLVVKREN